MKYTEEEVQELHRRASALALEACGIWAEADAQREQLHKSCQNGDADRACADAYAALIHEGRKLRDQANRVRHLYALAVLRKVVEGEDRVDKIDEMMARVAAEIEVHQIKVEEERDGRMER